MPAFRDIQGRPGRLKLRGVGEVSDPGAAARRLEQVERLVTSHNARPHAFDVEILRVAPLPTEPGEPFDIREWAEMWEALPA
jgi:hypothetical protein